MASIGHETPPLTPGDYLLINDVYARLSPPVRQMVDEMGGMMDLFDRLHSRSANVRWATGLEIAIINWDLEQSHK